MRIGGTVYSAQRTIAAVKPVACEKCGARYYYVMRRAVQGKGSAVYGLGGEAAAARALAAADDAVRHVLFNDADLVPCPDCHWIQPDMTTAEAARRYRWLGKAAFVAACGAVAFVVAALLALAQPYNGKQGPMIAGYFVIGVASAGACGACFLLRWALRKRLNLNAAHPAPPAPPTLPKDDDPPTIPLRLVPPKDADVPSEMFILTRVTACSSEADVVRLPNERSIRRLLGLDGRAPEPVILDAGSAATPSPHPLNV